MIFPDWLALLLLVLANFISGALLLVRLHSAEGKDAPAVDVLEFLFASLALGTCLVGSLALSLAEVGLFSAGLLALLWLAGALLLWLWPGRARLPRLRLPAAGRWELLLLTGWLVVALWLFMRPHEFIHGAADAGVYVNQAVSVANSGGLLVQEPFIAALDQELYPAFMRERLPNEGTRYYLLPAFNLADDRPGLVIPDFFHLHPVWQAVAYDLGGVWAALRLPGLWALLGSLAVYLTLRAVTGWPVALLALAGMSLNALQVWFARYPVTETLTQFLLWSSLWALGAWLRGKRPARLWALLAALTLGQLLLVRIDMVFVLALPVGLALWLWWRRSERAWESVWHSAAWYFLPLLLLTGHGVLHTLFISAPYATRIASYVRRTLQAFGPGLVLLVILVVVVGIVLGGVAGRYRHILRQRLPVWWVAYRRHLLIAATLSLLLLATYGWFVRPALGAANSYRDWYGGGMIVIYDHENLLRLGWYLSPLGVWLGVGGVCLMLWRGNRPVWPVLLVGLFFSLLYLWRIQNNPHQIYAMRRYVPVVMPFFIFSGAYLLGRLLTGTRRWMRPAGIALTLLWLAGLGWSARGFISQVDYRGLIAEMAALNQQLTPNSLLIFNDQNPVSLGDVVGTPLHFQYGHDVLTLRNPEAISDNVLLEALQNWQEAGRTIYWVGDAAFLHEHGLGYEASLGELPAVFLETPYDHRPQEIIHGSWPLYLHRLQEDTP